MTYSYRRGCQITLIREDGVPGPGETVEYLTSQQYKVSVQDEGCVEVMFYGEPSQTIVIPWWRIWQITV